MKQKEITLLKKRQYALEMLESRGMSQNLSDTVKLMHSPSVRSRMLAELQQCLIRIVKGCDYLLEHESKDDLLPTQLDIMTEYAAILDARMYALPPGVQ